MSTNAKTSAPLPLIPRDLSGEEFDRWIKADPRNRAAFHALVADTASGKLPASPELRAEAVELHAKHREQEALENVTARMKAFMEVMQRPGGTMIAEERLAQVNQLLDEATDAMLETPEPHRTRFLKELLPLREQIRRLKIKE